jgi:hypothetical protein
MAKPLFIIGSFGSGVKGLRTLLSRKQNVVTPQSTTFAHGGLALSNVSLEDIINIIESHKKLWADDMWFQIKGEKFVGIVPQLLEQFSEDALFVFTKRPLNEAIENYKGEEPVEMSTIQDQINIVDQLVESVGGTWIEVDMKGDTTPFDEDFNPIPASEANKGKPRNCFVYVLRPA